MYDEETAYSEEVNEQTPQPEVEVEPVKFGKKKVGIILVVLLVVLLMFLMVIGQISLTRRSGNRGNNPEPVQSSSSVDLEVSPNSEETDPISDESESYSSEVISPSSEESTTPVESETSEEESTAPTQSETDNESPSEPVENPSTQDTPDVVVEGSGVFEEVDTIPAMGAEVVTSGIVSGMSMYKLDNSYTYRVKIILVMGNESNIECSYFCPKNTYSALGIGDALTVTYQMDSKGNVSISSISK